MTRAHGQPRRSTASPCEVARGRDDPRGVRASSGIDTPTLCYGETLQPANACRVCVVELEGARVLAPACSRKVEAGHGRQDRLRARAPQPQAGAGVPRRPRSTSRPRRSPRATSRATTPTRALRAAGAAGPGPRPPAHRPPRGARRPDRGHRAPPVKVDNDLYVRDYSKCILCYKCVDACGDQWQNTFAITVAGRGFDARISTEYAIPLPDSACVYCGNCIAVCPTGALMFALRARAARGRARGTSRARRRPTRSARTAASAAPSRCTCRTTRSSRSRSPDDHDITRGNLCIKGRFGFQHVQAPAANRCRAR